MLYILLLDQFFVVLLPALPLITEHSFSALKFCLDLLKHPFLDLKLVVELLIHLIPCHNLILHEFDVFGEAMYYAFGLHHHIAVMLFQ